MIYDEENAIEDLVTTMKENINVAIQKINTEKNSVAGDVRFIEELNLDKFYFATLSEETLNYKKFFAIYDIESMPTSNQQLGNFSETINLFFEVGCFDEYNKDRNNTLFKLLRYRKAIRRVIQENPAMFRGYGKPLVTSLSPSVYPVSKSLTVIRAGVTVSLTLTDN